MESEKEIHKNNSNSRNFKEMLPQHFCALITPLCGSRKFPVLKEREGGRVGGQANFLMKKKIKSLVHLAENIQLG